MNRFPIRLLVVVLTLLGLTSLAVSRAPAALAAGISLRVPVIAEVELTRGSSGITLRT